ncbi:hypothetical protein BX616_004820 [Lobosporangium transversale]|uniref:NAD-dependent epimerase/dehydratase domain-containing protein n=1 Tax=Lobosporangium transversale TaxID=64571 RepID=A0A1Y2GC81_9FUNG|nr:hypothetical protein BCR41DRAFT_400004 [Lobosporangium transversale]KAF9918868.1 hypothetical protein BX616_004820 [Lobosporangium transversale]ORZ06805.1 hypothetical protein BCR41DRAFT_400004 [Lobosporangium transversale]|eukprot:XP_021877726.1 hypothetical protein BCR41DRAFT_400004 [Lobosporangium transversale]
MNSQDALLDDIHTDLLGRNDSPASLASSGAACNFDGVYTKRILLTGGAGFIGSALVRKLVLNYPEYFVLVLDKLDYCSSLNNLYPFLPPGSHPRHPSSSTIDELLNVKTTLSTASAQGAIKMTENSGRTSLKPYPNFKFIHGDITDLDTVQNAMMEYQIDTVIHMAAQTHVDKSFGESIDFTTNNVLGTHVMLEATRKVFCPPVRGGDGKSINTVKSIDSMKRFIFVSTDEVYGAVPFGLPDAKEDAPLAPSNPYSATKAAAECMVQAYHKSFRIPVIITRSNNIYGPFQYPEKIFPKFIMSLVDGNNINNGLSHSYISGANNISNGSSGSHDHDNKSNSNGKRYSHSGGGYCYIHGSGRHSRTYLYVTDVANALDVILHRGEIGQVYNIGGGHETCNLELAQDLIHRLIIRTPDRSKDSIISGSNNDILNQSQLPEIGEGLVGVEGRSRDYSGPRQDEVVQHLKECKECSDRIVFVEDRVFNDVRYAVDVSKLISLGWSPKVPFEIGIRKTIAWFKEHGRTWWGDIHRALYPHSVKLSAEESTTTSAMPSPLLTSKHLLDSQIDQEASG